MELNNQLTVFAKSQGIDFFGAADLSVAQDAIRSQGGPVVAEFPRAISIGIRLFDSVVDQLPCRSELTAAVNYRHHCYEVINLRLDNFASRISSRLQNDGYKAYPVPASERVDDETLSAVFSHKMAAHLAGLGWIGKNCLLITPQAGPRVRWITVLTDAPLKTNGAPMEENCDSCEQCVDSCPVAAFTGQPFRPDEPREVRYDAHKCDRYFSEMEEINPDIAVCGMCLYSCPYGLA